jgi:purine-binding chemotaxis protein CheW
VKTWSTFFLDGNFFGMPVQDVQEVVPHLPITPVPSAPPAVAGLFSLRGEILTAIELRACLGFPPRPEGQAPLNLVVHHGGEAVSLLVDEIGDVVTLEDSLFEPPPDTLRGDMRALIGGTYKLEHCLLLVLQTGRILEAVGPAALLAETPAAPHQRGVPS